MFAVKYYTKIVTVSESTLNDLIKVFPKYQDKIIKKSTSVPNSHGITNQSAVNIRKKYGIRGSYFLYVGELRPHKNVDGLIKAYKQFQEKHKDSSVCLVIGGKRHPSFIEENKNIKNINFIGFVDDDDLYSLYNNSLAFCLVSHYEGFGIPIIEAMASGTAVITSNTSSMPEVAGDAAILVDPTSTDSIENGLSQIYLNNDLRKKMIRMGKKQVKKFSWKKTADSIYNQYIQVSAKDK